MNTKTHKNITSIAIKALNYKIFNDNIEPIIFYSTQPDFDEIDGAFKSHFYNPATGKNYAGEYDSALTRYVKYYDMAIDLLHEGNNKYDEYLGRSIHYLVDLNTPVHTYNQDILDSIVNVTSHTAFENKCDELIDNFTNYGINKIKNINYFTINSAVSIGIDSALCASLLFDKYYNLKNRAELINIYNEAIINSIKNTVGILYKFSKSE